MGQWGELLAGGGSVKVSSSGGQGLRRLTAAAMAGLGAAIWVWGLLVPAALAASGLDEERLLTYLRGAAAHPLARPVNDVNDPVSVAFSMVLHNLELDERAETLTTNSWLFYDWRDPFLKWNISEYNGLKSVRIPVINIWHPDIEAYNSKDSQNRENRVVLYADGSILYVARAQITTTCTLDLTYFPFDTQKCQIIFGSWTYDGTDVNITLRNSDVNVSTFKPNKEWKLVDHAVKRTETIYDCCPEPYITVTFTLGLRRESSYFTYVYIGPVAIMSLLVVAIFILPAENPQKMTLGGSLLICFGLFFLEIGHILPPVHMGIPIIDRYYMAMYAMLAASVFVSAVITNIAKRRWARSHPSIMVKKVVLGFLGRLVCVNYTPYVNMQSDTEELCNVKTDTDPENARDSQWNNGACQIRDWFLIAKVLDRLFLVVYLFLTLIVTFSILIKYTQI